MSRKTSIVVTTIFEPRFLAGYLENLRSHGREQDTKVFIIPDRKTPASVAQAAEEARKDGFDVRCPDESEQAAFLKKLGLPEDFIPWNTDNRRNVGFLMALDAGCEVLISIDDDNFCKDDTDYVGEHVQGMRNSELGTRNSGDGVGWFNVCNLLENDSGIEVFPRGYPYYARNNTCIGPGECSEATTTAINAGLWLDDPDVDAVTRLSPEPKVTGFKGKSVVLGPDIWLPVNTQNTALTREAASVYYYVRMGYPLEGLRIDRYGDILSGYLLQKCAKHLGHSIRVGTPIVDHKRTPHNLFKDLYQELAGMVIIEELLPWLIEEPLDGRTYPEAYASLADGLLSVSGRFKGFVWDEGGRAFLRETANLMKVWLTAVNKIM